MSFVGKKLYVDVQLTMDNIDLANYVFDELQREFGTPVIDTWQKITDFVAEKSGNNITLARLYLENILIQETVTELDLARVSDRLPGSVIAFFNTELEDLKALSEELREIAMLAIAIAATDDYGLLPQDFEERLRLHTTSRVSIEEVLRITGGWLVQQRGLEIGPYSPIFALFATEDYNDELTQASRKLRNNVPAEEVENKPYMMTEANLELSQHLSRPERRPTLGDLAVFNSDNSIDTVSTLPSISRSIDTISDGPFTRRPSFRSNRPSYIGIERTLSQTSDMNLDSISSRLYSITDDEHFGSPPRIDSGDGLVSPYNLDTSAVKSLMKSRTCQDNYLECLEVSQASPSLCIFCHDNVLNVGSTYGDHYTSQQSARAATKHCVFCKELYMDKSGSVPAKFRWTTFRWTIRISAQARSGNRSVTIAFRPITDSQHVTPKQFHFFASNSLITATRASLGPNTSSTYTAPQIQSWIQTCNSSHPYCHKPSTPTFVPTRLLDLQSFDSSSIRLVNTKYENIREPYCTLSHVWGSTKFITTTLWNIEQHLLSGILYADLSKNFKEAIEVVKTLGIRYIWIDSLCIIQDPPGDFKTQGALMHAVYRNSYCNVVAADSESGEGGLFRERDPDEIVLATYTVPYSVNDTMRSVFGNPGQEWKIVSIDLWDGELLRRSIVYTRGWVFQERLLSPRILHFAHGQIFWDCATVSACEALPSGLPTAIDAMAATDRHWRGRLALALSSLPTSKTVSGAIDNESPYTFWDTAVTSYTSCELTSQSDKNVAIWSIAKILRDITGESYAVGMWSKRLVEQLAWQVEDTRKSERSPELQCESPSWTWTSMKGVMVPRSRIAERVYSLRSHKGEDLVFQAEDTKGGRDQMPVLVERALAVKGYIHEGRVRKLSGQGEIRWEFASEKVMMEAFPDEDPDGMSEIYAKCEFLLLAASEVGTGEEMLESSEYDSGDEDFGNESDEIEDNVCGTSSISETNGNENILATTSELEADEEPLDTDSTSTFNFTNHTYHGTGLLVVPLSIYNSMQARNLVRLETSHEVALKKSGPPCCSTWSCALKKDIDGIKAFSEAEMIRGTGEERMGRRYRRVGMVKFEDMDEGTYRLLMREQARDIWLE